MENDMLMMAKIELERLFNKESFRPMQAVTRVFRREEFNGCISLRKLLTRSKYCILYVIIAYLLI